MSTDYTTKHRSKTYDQIFEEILRISNFNSEDHKIRSIILEIDLYIENQLRKIYYNTFYYHLFLTNDPDKDRKIEQDFEKKIEKLHYKEIWNILEATMLTWPYPDFKNIEKIKKLRNEIAHKNSRDVEYRGKKIFNDKDCLNQLLRDFYGINSEIKRYFWHTIQKHRSQLEKYVKTYGDTLLY